MDPKIKELLKKTFIFIVSLTIAWLFLKTGYFHIIIDKVLPIRFVSEFIAGILYTSFLTSPISVAMLLVAANSNNPILVALVAGLGAACGDLIMIRFFRKKIKENINTATKMLFVDKVREVLKFFKLDFIVVLIGAVIIASPLPDEIGLIMFGASKMEYKHIALITYILNTAGILLIVVPANVFKFI